MLLLTPDKIKSDKREEQDKIQLRGIAIAEEENRLVGSLNMTRDTVGEQTLGIQQDFEAFKADIELKKGVLSGEVVSLEARRREAMKPIEDLRVAADAHLLNAQNLDTAASAALEAVKGRESVVQTRERNTEIAETAILGREQAIQPKEDALAKREQAITAMSAALDAKRTEQEAVLRAREDAVAVRETQVRTDAEHNKTVEELQAVRQKQQDENDRKIASNYQALAAATAEIEAKKHANI